MIWRLVALGGAVCLLASAVAISLFHRARASQGGRGWIGSALDAVAAGCGIWATHFIAMLAYDPGSVAGYNIGMTLLSLVLRDRHRRLGLRIALLDGRRLTVALGGAVVGARRGGDALHRHDGARDSGAHRAGRLDLVAVSILLGCVLGALALVVAARGEGLAHGGCCHRCC